MKERNKLIKKSILSFFFVSHFGFMNRKPKNMQRSSASQASYSSFVNSFQFLLPNTLILSTLFSSKNIGAGFTFQQIFRQFLSFILWVDVLKYPKQTNKMSGSWPIFLFSVVFISCGSKTVSPVQNMRFIQEEQLFWLCLPLRCQVSGQGTLRGHQLSRRPAICSTVQGRAGEALLKL